MFKKLKERFIKKCYEINNEYTDKTVELWRKTIKDELKKDVVDVNKVVEYENGIKKAESWRLRKEN